MALARVVLHLEFTKWRTLLRVLQLEISETNPFYRWEFHVVGMRPAPVIQPPITYRDTKSSESSPRATGVIHCVTIPKGIHT